MLLRMLPMFVVAMVVVPADRPGVGARRRRASAGVRVAVACFAGARAVSAALTTLMNITLLWTISGDGVPMLIATCATMFGGLIIPLPLFPGLGAAGADALPFAGHDRSAVARVHAATSRRASALVGARAPARLDARARRARAMVLARGVRRSWCRADDA